MGQSRTLPSVGQGLILEEESRLALADTLRPWAIQPWRDPADVGIDAIVEVRNPGPNGSATPTGTRFAVQLKSGSAAARPDRIPVKTKTLRYWLQGDLVLLVYCVIPTRELWALWIDEPLLRAISEKSKNWSQQETVGIPLTRSFRLSADVKAQVAAYAASYVRKPFTVLRPGEYMELQSRASHVARKVRELANATHATSVAAQANEIERRIAGATFRVAIAGPTRAGKSSLINALLRRTDNLLPTGDDRTTAIPIVVGAAERDEMRFLHDDGHEAAYDLDPNRLHDVAAQRFDKKSPRVRVVAVGLQSTASHVGIEFIDAPGLHDPDESIVAITRAYLKTAHAFVYVIDVSSHALGGFSVMRHHLDDLRDLLQISAHVLIVGHKADALTEEQCNEVKRRICRDLAAARGTEQLADGSRISFASAKAAAAWLATGQNSPNPLHAFESMLWSHLLRENAAGVGRLARTVTELAKALGAFSTFLDFATADAAKARTLADRLLAARPEVAAAHDWLGARRLEQEAELETWRKTSPRAIREELKSWVRHSGEVPDKIAIQSRAEGLLRADVLRLAHATRTNLASIAAEIDLRIQQVLFRVRIDSSTQTVTDDLANARLPTPDISEIFVQDLVIGGVLGLLAAAALEFTPLGWFVLGFRFLWRASREGQVASADKAISKVEEALTKQNTQVCATLTTETRTYYRALDDRLRDRLDVFVHDAQQQLDAFGVNANPNRRAVLAAALTRVPALVEELKSVQAQLFNDMATDCEAAAPV